MEPRIQYAQTSDGVSIAFWTLGEGPPLVHMPNPPWSHIQREWHVPGRRDWYERLAEKRKLIRYDNRGSGLSERNVTDYSLDALVLDIEGVVDRLRLERFALFGYIVSGPLATAYAARHPERVSHLLLWCAAARPSVVVAGSRAKALRTLATTDWELFTQTFAHIAMGWSEGEAARTYAAFMRECTTAEAAQAAYDAIAEYDVTTLLPQVRAPTLVLERGQRPWLDMDVARGLTSLIPDARLLLLEGESSAPYLGDMEAALDAIDEFLGEGEEAAGAEAPQAPEAGAFRTVLFTDVEGSTALTQRLGDAKARELLRQHERIVRDALRAHGGSEVKTTGDGFMTSFSSATRALESAIAMQRAFAAHNESAEEPILVRVGLNAGEPIAEEDPDGRSDLYGTAVNLAARICGHAEAGQILASNVVQELAAGKGFVFTDQGDATLKGFDKPVRLFEVRWQDT